MPTIQQIDSFRKKARAKGFSEAQIEQSIAKRVQTEVKASGLTPQGPQRPQAPTPIAPVSPPPAPVQPEQPEYSLGGLVKNAGQDVLDFAVNNPLQAAKNLFTLGKEGSRASALKGAGAKSNKQTNEQVKIVEQLRKEKDPVKKQQLIEKSRQLSGQVEKTSTKLGKLTDVGEEEMVDLEQIPKNPVELGKGILKNVGRTLGLKQGADGSIVFDPTEALKSAYEKPVTTAMLAKDLTGGIRKLAKGGAKDVTESGLSKTEPINVYRAGNEELNLSKTTNQGISFSTDKSYAESFGKSKGQLVKQYSIDPNAKILEAIPKKFKDYNKDGSFTAKNGVKLEFAGKEEFQDIIDYARKEGYDAVNLTGFNAPPGLKGEAEIRVLNPDIVLQQALKPGTLEKVGSNLRRDVLNPQADASPFYADDVAVIQKAQEKIGLSGSTEHQLSQLPKAFKKSQTEIKSLLRSSPSPKKGVLTSEFSKNIVDSNYGLEESAFASAVKTETNVLKKLEGKSASAYYEQLGKYRELLKSTRKKIDKGTTLLPKEEARLAAFNALKDTIDTVSPEVRAINTLQNQMFNISEGLVKGQKKGGIGVELFGSKVGIPAGASQTIKDATGRGLEVGAKIPGQVSSKIGGVIPSGLGSAMAVSDIAQPVSEPVEQGIDGLQDPRTEAINEQNETDGKNYSDKQQIDLQNNGDIISQSAPLFGKLSKQEVIRIAVESGANQKQIKEITEYYDLVSPTQAGVATEEQQKAASGLRTEYLSQTKQNGYLDVVNAYRKVSSASDTAAGDVSLIFAYMKMLDPGSTVREGEFATAEQTAGIPDRIVNLYNKAAKGSRLGPKQRAEFKSAAKDVYDQSSIQQKQIDDIYVGLAGKYGVDPSLLGIGAIGVK